MVKGDPAYYIKGRIGASNLLVVEEDMVGQGCLLVEQGNTMAKGNTVVYGAKGTYWLCRGLEHS